MDADASIPWRELERDAVVVDTPVSYLNLYVQGVRMIQEVPCTPFGGDDIASFRMCAFDCSKRGCSTLQGADGKIVRAAWREGGRDLSLEWSKAIVHDDFGALGNGAFYNPVCGFCLWKVHEG